MSHLLYPNERRKSVYQMDFSVYWQKGYRGIIFDIDNTLVPHGKPATEEAVELFRKLHETGFDTCLLSNNKEPRITPFAAAVTTKFICDGGKPAKRGYRQAMEKMGTDEKNTLFIGDQIFTDVWGARRCGIYSILVEPIHPKEEIQIVLKRYLEKIVLFFYERSRKKGDKHEEITG